MRELPQRASWREKIRLVVTKLEEICLNHLGSQWKAETMCNCFAGFQRFFQHRRESVVQFNGYDFDGGRPVFLLNQPLEEGSCQRSNSCAGVKQAYAGG